MLTRPGKQKGPFPVVGVGHYGCTALLREKTPHIALLQRNYLVKGEQSTSSHVCPYYAPGRKFKKRRRNNPELREWRAALWAVSGERQDLGAFSPYWCLLVRWKGTALPSFVSRLTALWSSWRRIVMLELRGIGIALVRFWSGHPRWYRGSEITEQTAGCLIVSQMTNRICSQCWLFQNSPCIIIWGSTTLYTNQC